MSDMALGLKCAAVICVLKSRDTNKYLLLKRNKNPHFDKYIPVGGKLEPFETPDAAAKRELFEETGILECDLKLHGIMTETSPVKYNWILYIYTGVVDEFLPGFCDEGTLEWVSEKTILDLPTPTTDWFIYKLLLEGRAFILDAHYDADLNLLFLRDEVEGIVLYNSKKNV